MFRQNPKYLKLKNTIETTYKEMKEMNQIVGNEINECYVKLEVLILDAKIEMYEFLINETNYYNEGSIKLLQKKLDYLNEMKEASYIIRKTNHKRPILLQELNDYEFE